MKVVNQAEGTPPTGVPSSCETVANIQNIAILLDSSMTVCVQSPIVSLWNEGTHTIYAKEFSHR
jgi:hypothetical protein